MNTMNVSILDAVTDVPYSKFSSSFFPFAALIG